MSIVSYEIEVDGTDIVDAGMPTLVGGRRQFSVTGFDPLTEHDFRVRSVSAAGLKSAWSSVVSATTLDAFNPLTSNKAWAVYLADSLPGADGAAIPNSTTWTSETGGNHANLYTPGNGLAIQHNEIGGHKALQFTGADNVAHISPPSLAGLTAGEIYLIWKITDLTPNAGNVLGVGGGTPLYPFHTEGDGKIYDDFGSTTQKNALTSQITILNTWHLYNAWSATNDWGLYQNSTAVHTTATNTVGFSDAPRIGNNTNGSIVGLISAVFIFSAKLTTDERTEMYEWLAAQDYM